jgi:hypothetical protein
MSYLPGALGQAIFSAAAAASVAPRRGTVTGLHRARRVEPIGDFNRSNQAFSVTGGAWSNSAPQRLRTRCGRLKRVGFCVRYAS